MLEIERGINIKSYCAPFDIIRSKNLRLYCRNEMELFNSNVLLLVTVCMCFQGAYCQIDYFTLMKTFSGLLHDNSPPEGEPFPIINGPKQDEKVCIVGAGPAGIDMALRLKDKGYSKITMFEKTGRVGGKSYDTQINGVYRPQGTIFITADYFDNIVKLAKRYHVGELKAIPLPVVSNQF